MKMAFQVMASPYTHQDVDTTINLAESALKMGHDVEIFLFCDAVIAANSQVKPVKIDRNIPAKLKELGERGARIQICGLCYQYRGLDAAQTIPGSSMSGLPDLARLVAECDRFISLTG